jgi:hypothetical protein
MNMGNDVIPQGGTVQQAAPPADRQTAAPEEQAPLGAQPTYDELLDAAVDYTFPCSDPIAAGACSEKLSKPSRA